MLNDSDATPLYSHDLRILWRHVRPTLETVGPLGPPGTLDRVQAILHELADADGRTGTGFRYSKDRDGQPSLQSDLEINVKTVQAVMATVSQILDGASAGIQDMRAAEHNAADPDYC
jgi:hypothetical protein